MSTSPAASGYGSYLRCVDVLDSVFHLVVHTGFFFSVYTMNMTWESQLMLPYPVNQWDCPGHTVDSGVQEKVVAKELI